MAKRWKTVSPENRRDVWQCPDCKDKAKVNPSEYAEIGTPFCSECDTEMELVKTEAKA